MKRLLLTTAFALFFITSCDKKDEPEVPTLKPAEFTIDVESKDFGEVEISKEVSQEFTITNKGEFSLDLKSFEFRGAGASEFSTNAKATIIKAGKSYKFTVTFKPTKGGDKNVLLLIASQLGSHKVILKGKTPKPAEFTIDLESKDFGEVEISREVSQEFTITNKGETNLELKSFEISGTDKSDFTTEIKPTIVEAGKISKFTVTFKPTESGNKTALLTIVSNLGNHKITLKGKGKVNAKPFFIENPYDEKNIGGGAFLSNNPMRLSRLAFDIDVKKNTTFAISKLTINTTGKNPNATPENPDNQPFIFKIRLYESTKDLPGAKIKESETKLVKTTELEGRVLGGQSQLFSRELTFNPIELKAGKEAKKYWLEVSCSRVAGLEVRTATKVGLNLAASRSAFSSEKPEWVISGGQQPQDVVYKLEGVVY